MIRAIKIFILTLCSTLCATAQGLGGYEVWIDDNYQKNQWPGTVSYDSAELTIDYSGLTEGLHFLSMRAYDTEGNWGPMSRAMFIIPGNDIKSADMSYVEYWIDNDYHRMKTSKGPEFVVDYSGYEPGLHFLNYRAVNTLGCWGAMSRVMFVVPDPTEVEDTMIVGYSYSFGSTVTYVAMQPTDYMAFEDEDELVFSIPQLSQCCKITDNDVFEFSETAASLNREDVKTYFGFRALGNKGHWSPLYTAEILQSQNIVHEYKNLVINHALTADIPTEGDFVAFSFEVPSGRYTIKSSKEAKIAIYKADGSEKMVFSEAETYNGIKQALKGKYYGIAYNVYAQDDASTFTIRISDSSAVISPDIEYANGQVTMTCGEGGEIFYTLDGSEPTKSSIHYEGPFTIDRNCTIKAIAVYSSSTSTVTTYEVTSFKAAMPKAEISETEVRLSCDTPDAKIYYTLDGSHPGDHGALYTAPIAITKDATLKAVAKREGYTDSEILEISITAPKPKCEKPTFRLDGTRLEIISDLEGATIYYTIGDAQPTVDSELYLAPVQLTDNRPVHAIACADGYNPSDVATFTHSLFACADVKVDYNGRYLTLTTDMTGAEIHYTLDGSAPTAEADLYLGEVDVNGIGTVRAIATRQYFNPGKETTYQIPVYYDGTCATVATAGALAKGFEWCGTDDIARLQVKGNIDAIDLATMRSIKSLRHLDISETQSNEAIPANGLANTDLISVSLPATVKGVGSGIFAGCLNLAAVKWNAKAQIPGNLFDGLDNPNLLLYVGKASYAPAGVTNVVVDGHADAITLTDGDHYNFFCPEAFVADRIVYTHQYTMTSGIDQSAGWETLALPFDVTRIMHAGEEIAPFAAAEADAKHFWLYSLGEKGFVPASTIEANMPYIISMPNNDIYDPTMRLTQPVSFVGEGVTVPVTKPNVVKKGGYTFVPTTMHTPKLHTYAINRYVAAEGYLPGGGFVYELRDISPFEAYFTHDSTVLPKKAFAIFDLNDDSASPSILGDNENMQIYAIGSDLYIKSSARAAVEIYSMGGALVRAVNVESGITVISDLQAGFYIVNRQKVIIR